MHAKVKEKARLLAARLIHWIRRIDFFYLHSCTRGPCIKKELFQLMRVCFAVRCDVIWIYACLGTIFIYCSPPS